MVPRGKRQIPSIPSFLLPPVLQGFLGGANSLAGLSTTQLRLIACTGNNSLVEETVHFDNNITTVSTTILALTILALTILALTMLALTILHM